jgi:hypothetical protein
MEKQGPIVAWIVDDTGFVKRGTFSVGVARQYCGRVGKHRARLRGTQAGTGTGPLRRARLARVSPSCHFMYRRLWVPGRGEEPFFPLHTRQLLALILTQSSVLLPPKGIAPYAHSDMTPGPSPRFDMSLQGPCFGNCPGVLFAGFNIYNTAALGYLLSLTYR